MAFCVSPKNYYSAVALTVSLEQIQCGTPTWRRIVSVSGSVPLTDTWKRRALPLQRERATEAAGTQAGLRGMGNRNGQLDAGSFLADTGMARTKSQVRLVIHPHRDRMDIETYLARLNFHATPKPGLSFDNFFKPILRAVPYEPINCRRGIIVNRRAVHREYPVDIIFLNLF